MKIQLRCYDTNRIIGTTDRRREQRRDWIRDMAAEWTGCDPDFDRIETIETDGGEEIHVNGRPVARVRYLVGWEALGVG